MFDGWSPGHLPLYWYEQQFPEQLAASFKFAFVRGNELGQRDRAAQKLVSHYRDFDDFVGRWLHPETIHRQLLFAAQTDFLTDSLGHLALDFIGYQEHLERDFQLVCEQLGRDAVLPHINSIDNPYEAPLAAECEIDTENLQLVDVCFQLSAFLLNK